MPERQARKSARTVLIASLANIALTAAAMTIFVSRSDDARKDNCVLVSDALDAYTEGLILASTKGTLSKEEQADIDKRVAVLHSVYDPILARCR